MLGRKGMSPLIATILLIAFAVALGTMIMSWTGGIESEGGVNAPPKDCAKIKIQTELGACYADNSLSFTVKNAASGKISGMRLKSITDDQEFTTNVKDSAMIANEEITRSVPFLYGGGNIQINFIPLVQVDGELFECTDSRLMQQELPNC